MTGYRSWIVVPIIALLGLAGCVAYEPGYRHPGAYYAPAQVRVAPAPRYWGGPPRHHHDYRRW